MAYNGPLPERNRRLRRLVAPWVSYAHETSCHLCNARLDCGRRQRRDGRPICLAANTGQGRPDLHQGRGPDHFQELRGLSSARGNRPDVAPHLRGRPAVGQGNQGRGERAAHAAVACRRASGHVSQRADDHRCGARNAGRLGERRRTEGRSGAAAPHSQVPRRLERRHARRRPADAGGLQAASRRHHPVPSTSTFRPTSPNRSG